MGWKIVESTIKPEEIDKTSSKEYVYVRRDIEEVTETDTEGNEVTKYVYQENKIPKSDWEYYQQLENNADTLDNLLTEVIPSLLQEV